eukprot:scaffold173489_cov45-Prasinocladus_malaysianus.AAC.1
MEGPLACACLVIDTLVAVRAAGRQVVVDDVHHDPQAHPVEGGHHPPELQQPCSAIDRLLSCVGALGDPVEHRVVAPVEAVA